MANTINGLFPNSIFGIKSVDVKVIFHIDSKLNDKIMLSEHLRWLSHHHLSVMKEVLSSFAKSINTKLTYYYILH